MCPTAKYLPCNSLYLCLMKTTKCPLLGYMDLSGFARAVGVSYFTAYRWAKEGRIRAWQVGRFWAVPIDEVERVIVQKRGGL